MAIGALLAGSAGSGALMAMTAISAAGQIYSGMAQKASYDSQAAQAKVQGRSNAIAYRQQGADVLRNLNQTLAAGVAAAGAGGIDPTSGSARVIQNFARAEAYGEYGTALDNATLAREGAKTQAQIYRQAGKAAMIGGMFNAVGTIAGGMYQQQQLGMGALNISAPTGPTSVPVPMLRP